MRLICAASPTVPLTIGATIPATIAATPRLLSVVANSWVRATVYDRLLSGLYGVT